MISETVPFAARPPSGIRPGFSLVVMGMALSCGGLSPEPSQATGVPSDPPEQTEQPSGCVNVEFAAAPGVPTGIVACDSAGQGMMDLYMGLLEPCNGRGVGEQTRALTTAAPYCTSDTDCRPGTSCGPWRQCHLPATCDGGDQDGQVCLCAGIAMGAAVVGYNQWVTSECRSDADCQGYACALSAGNACGGRIDGIFCHTQRDQCAKHADCQSGEICVYEPTVRHWQCRAIAACN